MAIKIPLNKFRRVSARITTVAQNIYTAPLERAAIIIQAQVTNRSPIETTCTAYVSALGDPITYKLVEQFPIPAYDARNILSGRLILQGVDGGSITKPDSFIILAESSDRLDINLGILETKNTD